MYKNSDLNCAIANTDCDDLINKVDYWICGHTHKYNLQFINKCTLLCNPYGYLSENPNFIRQQLII